MREDGSRSQNSRTFFNSFNSLRYRKTSYSIDLCPRDLITKSWRQRSRSYEKTVQFWIGHRTAAVSMKKTSVAAADYSTIRLRRPSLSDSICLLDNMHGQRPNFHPIFTLHSLFITDILSAAHQNGAVTGWAGGRQLYMWKFFFSQFFLFHFSCTTSKHYEWKFQANPAQKLRKKLSYCCSRNDTAILQLQACCVSLYTLLRRVTIVLVVD